MNLIMMLLREKSIASIKKLVWNGMQMTLKKCENHFTTVLLTHCAVAHRLSPVFPSLSCARNLRQKQKLKRIFCMQIFVYIVVVSFRFDPILLVYVRSLVHIFSQTSLFFSQVLQNLLPISPPNPCALSLCLFRCPFSRNFYYYCFLLWFYFSRIGFEKERRKKVFFSLFFCSSQTSF